MVRAARGRLEERAVAVEVWEGGRCIADFSAAEGVRSPQLHRVRVPGENKAP
jgi:hypothetical protein